jgi:hypothetical protein
MTFRPSLRRCLTVAGGATALVVLGATSASAHHCYVPMYSLNGPTSGNNWLVFSAGDAAQEMLQTELCDAQLDAGYEALEEAGLPVGIKIFEKMTIGAGMQDQGKGHENPRGADGHGLEFFGSGSTLADETLATFNEAASAASCD